MGRRNVNTTKSGKYMNPTDQARKEARKKELKKNKKQRMAVRQAVLKSKDPLQLLEEATIYDKQEYDPSVQAQLNERVLQEKRRKLLETFDRLIILYRKEDVELANRLQAAREDYDKRRQDMMLYYEQVKLAERVKASEIPLPDLPPQIGFITSEIPLPSIITKSALKKSIPHGIPPGFPPLGRKPPGPPPGTPPDLSDSDSEDLPSSNKRKIRFAEDSIGDSSIDTTQIPSNANLSGFSAVPPSQIPLPMNMPMFSSIIRPGFPGAPLPPQSIHSCSGPILSAPPSLNMRHDHSKEPLDAVNKLLSIANNTSESLSIVRGTASSTSGGGTTIQAKPQLKNLIGDATRFVPTSLKVRRTTRDSSGRVITVGGGVPAVGVGQKGSVSSAYEQGIRSGISRANQGQQASKDDAYDEFMREMENLL